MLFALIDWGRVIKEAGFLAYPLGLCSFVSVFIICERTFALRDASILPNDLAEAVLQGRPVTGGSHSALSRIIAFVERHPGDTDGAKAYARLEFMRMERGVSYLDTIYTGAPLLGLIGTVSGLLAAFNVIDPDTQMPDPVKFTESIGYALSATLIGLCVAIIALAGNGYLGRKIDHHAARLDVLLERILARSATHPESSAVPAK